MIDLQEIKKQVEPEIQNFDRFVIREYLQHKILEIIYASDYGKMLIFMGGTCLRIVHGNKRFSEDLDFDNRGLTEEEWSSLTQIIRRELQIWGVEAEINEVKKNAWHIYIRFPKLQYDLSLSGYETEKILIQVDAESQDADYLIKPHLLNKWDVFQMIQTVPLQTLLAQKIYALINWKREKGRDLFDIVFLMSLQIKPDYHYLEQKMGISSKELLKTALLNRLSNISLEEMSRDVQVFLFKQTDVKKVHLFDQAVEFYAW